MRWSSCCNEQQDVLSSSLVFDAQSSGFFFFLFFFVVLAYCCHLFAACLVLKTQNKRTIRLTAERAEQPMLAEALEAVDNWCTEKRVEGYKSSARRSTIAKRSARPSSNTSGSLSLLRRSGTSSPTLDRSSERTSGGTTPSPNKALRTSSAALDAWQASSEDDAAPQLPDYVEAMKMAFLQYRRMQIKVRHLLESSYCACANGVNYAGSGNGIGRQGIIRV